VLKSLCGKTARRDLKEGGRVTGRSILIIYISFKQPYRIDKYSPKGRLLASFMKKTKYNIIKPDLEVVKDGIYIDVKNNLYTKISRDVCVQGNYIYHLVTNGTDMIPYGRYIDVFSLEGRYVNTIDPGHYCQRIHVTPNNRLYVVVKPGITLPNQKEYGNTNIGFPRVVIYQLHIKGDEQKNN